MVSRLPLTQPSADTPTTLPLPGRHNTPQSEGSGSSATTRRIVRRSESGKSLEFFTFVYRKCLSGPTEQNQDQG